VIPTANLASLLLNTATRLPDLPGLIHGELTRSWGEMAARVRSAAGALVARGIVKGDRVLVHARNSASMFETMWACWMVGAVFVPTNFRLTPPEIGYLAESSGAVLHIFDREFPEHAKAALNDAVGAQIWMEEWDELARFPQKVARPVDVDRDDCCWFFYTSGTTGRPKAGMLTHSQMAFVVNNHICDLMPGLSEHDASLVIAPLSHGAGVHSLSQVARGAVSILPMGERFDADQLWQLVERYRVSNMFTVPTIINMLCRNEAVDRYDHSSLRYVIYAGAPMYRADQIHALNKLGQVLVQYFGLGEVTGNITVLPPSLHSSDDDPSLPTGSCGYARTGMEIAILSPDGAYLQPMQTGEICVRGAAVFAGYFNNSDANAKAFAHGWFHTGDLGHLDARGFLFITGRESDMYISGGSNVYPREIEELLLTHPAIAEACVVGVPDEKWGESGVAVLVINPGHNISLGELMQHLDGRIAKYKTPGRVVVWESLPKSGYGKVVKREVIKLLAQ
jgi:acyl-CoA synthetase (AMP-forming)/AMP-acid ligase II